MTYDEWLEQVENYLWSLLGDSLDDYPDADLEGLYEANVDPVEVPYRLYEELEDEE